MVVYVIKKDTGKGKLYILPHLIGYSGS